MCICLALFPSFQSINCQHRSASQTKFLRHDTGVKGKEHEIYLRGFCVMASTGQPVARTQTNLVIFKYCIRENIRKSTRVAIVRDSVYPIWSLTWVKIFRCIQCKVYLFKTYIFFKIASLNWAVQATDSLINIRSSCGSDIRRSYTGLIINISLARKSALIVSSPKFRHLTKKILEAHVKLN